MAKFQTSARSVDMLGRQQIAGIPTAISEIFKNAYDAYATGVRGDLFPEPNLLMIRDDGIGMSREDFLKRWLTIGTESKAAGSTIDLPPQPPDVPSRKQMGEKGIGRLAIASTGPQLLVVTRPLKTSELDSEEVVVALVQWSFFEIPGLLLEDVTVPMRTVAGTDEVDRALLASMRDEVTEALSELGSKVPPSFGTRIREELSSLDFDPARYLRINGPGPASSSGTAFLVCPANDDLQATIEADDKDSAEFSVSEFQRFLLGFTNTISPEADTPEFSTEFIRHDSTGFEDIIDPSSYFWDADDFRLTDHTIDGEFDEFGNFSGTVSIYGGAPAELSQPWIKGRGQRTACGPFAIKFGYVQGKASESTLTGEDFAVITRRLQQIGGLYVYRDGIRVLPYGNSDNDYLEIEKRRSLNAGTYYFSYRRMFGAISLDSVLNRQLQEKAGREGFRDNRAFRDFRAVLKDFLIQLAADFFSVKGDDSDEWKTGRERLDRHSESRAKRAKLEERARAKFASAVADQLSLIEGGGLVEAVQVVVGDLQRRIAEVEPDRVALDLPGLERVAAQQLAGISQQFSLERPSGMALTLDQERDWRSLVALKPVAIGLVQEGMTSLQVAFDDAYSVGQEAASKAEDLAARQARVNAVANEARAALSAGFSTVDAGIDAIGAQIREAAQREIDEFDRSVSERTSSAVPTDFTDEVTLSDEIERLGLMHGGRLRVLAQQVDELVNADQVQRELVALKEENFDLQSQIEANLELLQLGQAVQVVSHEFEASIRSVRAGLRKLGPWAKSTPRLQPVVRDLRASFAHLDGYLRLFTPLQRRLYRESVVITGAEVESFLIGVFGERLKRHEVQLTVSDAFRAWQFEGFPSTFYPAFVNLVDNAIYWVGLSETATRQIELDADVSGTYVRDSGPGVRARDSQLIFERGFSRRRGGRGLGLSLAHELLARDGWELDLLPANEGAAFRIAPRSTNENER